MENIRELFFELVQNNTDLTNIFCKYQVDALNSYFIHDKEGVITDNLCLYPNLSTSFYLNNNPIEKGVEFSTIEEIFNAKKDYNYFILLGESGYGKSTLLKKIRIDYLFTSLSNKKEQVCLFVEFKNYVNFSNRPLLDVLNERWKNIAPTYMPSFSELLNQGKVLLLMDAINEVKCYDKDIIDTISRCIADISSINSNNKIIVSCRTSSYYPSWFTFPDKLGEIDIKAFNSDKIQKYLAITIPDISENIYKLIRKDNLLSFYSVPYYLSLLVNSINNHGKDNIIGIPNNLNNLFKQFVKTAIIREIRNSNSVFINDNLITKEYQNFMIRNDTLEVSKDFINKSPFFKGLSFFAYEKFNQACPIGEYELINVFKDFVLDSNIIEAGICLGFIESNHLGIVFKHHLLQSYFASIYLYSEFEQDVSKISDLTINFNGSWKDTMLFLASFITNKDKLKAFVNFLVKIDDLLACECVAQEKTKLDAKFIDDFENIVLNKCTNDRNISQRIIAGLILGKLGDNRFKLTKNSKGTNFIIPPLERIEGGKYKISFDINSKVNIDTLEVDPFLIGKYPVTNLEYGKFIEAGGYQEVQYWESNISKKWLKGEWKEWVKTEWINKHKILQKRKLLPLFLLLKGTTTIFQSYSIYKMAYATENEIIKMLEAIYQKREIYTKVPRFWYDPDFNNPSQPILGISWLEANAFCKWLSIQTGRHFRLPTEWEWEIVARGIDGLRFPYGNDFNKHYCNVYESEFSKAPSPVGIFPEGKTLDTSCFDLSGNVFEWTDSFYNDIEEKCMRASAVISETDIYKTISCRGGSWSHLQFRATGYYRGRANIFTRNNDLGFRVLCEI
jgi:formylglycine-generating enzyme required for sulfatase activity